MSGAGSLVVYHTSDVHARRGFGARLASIVEPGALLVDSGDALAGSSTVYRRREDVMREFGTAPYAALAVGNREFHYLHRCMLARARAMRAPWICSNLIDLRERPSPFAREMIVSAGTARVRLLALLAPQYRTGSGWESIFGWRFLAPEAALDGLLRHPADGVDATLLLSHLGLAADREIARRFAGLSAILGGHSHETLEHPEIGNGVPIAHPGPYARYVGRLELSLDGVTPRVASYRLIPLLAAEAGA